MGSDAGWDISATAATAFTRGQVVGRFGTDEGDALLYTSDVPNDLLSVAADGTVTVVDPTALHDYLVDNDGLSFSVWATDGVEVIEISCKFGDDWPAAQARGVGKGVGFIPQAGGMWVVDDQGNTYYPATAADLIQLLRDLKAQGRKISRMAIKGHGWDDPPFIQLPDGTFLTADNGRIQIDGQDVTQLFRDVTGPNTDIRLRGCYTYLLAKNIRAVLGNGAGVWGAVRFVLGVPFTTYGFGVYR